MMKLHIYLPPFAGDFAGVCAALDDLSCVSVICDAACCTKGYIDYDEPRQQKAAALSAQLRAVGVALGDEDRILRQTVQEIRRRQPDLAALVGTPVPWMTGMDLGALAMQAEQATATPVFGFDTTGFAPYWRGISAALLAVLERFADPDAPKVPHSVNLLGLTPLDFGTSNEPALRHALERCGFRVLCSFLQNSTLEDVSRSPGAAVNLVLSVSGLPMAREMERRFGIPFLTGVPVGEQGLQALCAELDGGRVQSGFQPSPEQTGKILIVADRIIGNSLRRAMTQAGCPQSIVVGSFFDREPSLMEPQDLFFAQEATLIEALRSRQFSKIIGDPLLQRIPAMRELAFIPLPHPAVSGCLHWDQMPVYPSLSLHDLL